MAENKQGKLLIFSAPSGSGKSTLVNHLLENIPEMAFPFRPQPVNRVAMKSMAGNIISLV